MPEIRVGWGGVGVAGWGWGGGGSNVRFKVGKRAKAMRLAFVLLDLEYSEGARSVRYRLLIWTGQLPGFVYVYARQSV